MVYLPPVRGEISEYSLVHRARSSITLNILRKTRVNKHQSE